MQLRLMLLIFSLHAPTCLDIDLAAFNVLNTVFLVGDPVKVIHVSFISSELSE